jgi:2-polyprenyl-3-methyl-5-hydroxy-6-metoxy-1,4-benzoquinol methylase
MTYDQDNDHIATTLRPACYMCGAPGRPLYHGLRDRLFGAAGVWALKRCSNASCGLIWLDPMPNEEDVWKAYRQYYTHADPNALPDSWRRRAYLLAIEAHLAASYGYKRRLPPVWQHLLGRLLSIHPGWRADADFSVMHLPARPGGRLLDVGCGDGRLLSTMRDLGWKVEGVDFDRAAVEQARTKGLRVHLGTLEAQGYPDDYFDAVTLSHVIEHVHDPLGLLQECRRILKPQGHLVVVTPNTASLTHRIFGAACFNLDPPRHLHLFNRRTLRWLAELAGFQAPSVHTTLRFAEGSFIASRDIARTGTHVMGGPQPRAIRLWGRIMQLAEWAALQWTPEAGEEIALVART